MGAGRTDAGVHAKQMYAHFNVATIANEEDLVRRLNSFLPDDIAVQNIINVPEDAHARFNATERTYEYWVTQHKNPFTIPTPQPALRYRSHTTNFRRSRDGSGRAVPSTSSKSARVRI